MQKMNASPLPLFRKEVLEHRANRLQGDVSLAVPVSWQSMGYLLLATLVVALIFLATASYARTQTVMGAIVLDTGVASIVPSRAGVVIGLTARDGASVHAGQTLIRVRSEEDLAAGRTAPGRVIAALDDQDRRLAAQTALVMQAANAQQSGLVAQITGLTEEIYALDSQVADQLRLVTVAEDELRDVQAVAAKGFISRRDLETRETTLILRRQQLSQLRQARTGKMTDLAEARRAIIQASAAAQSQVAGVESNRAELAQQVAQAEAAQGYALTSPIDGTVTAVTARVGQPTAPGQPLMIVVPAGGRPRVELYVPTSAAGFLATGQSVRLAVDAFPYQRYGMIDATIVTISSAAIPKVVAGGEIIPVYLVTARLSRPWVIAFGRRQPLLPGMTLTARIITEKQTLIEWLFEPLFAVRRR